MLPNCLQTVDCKLLGRLMLFTCASEQLKLQCAAGGHFCVTVERCIMERHLCGAAPLYLNLGPGQAYSSVRRQLPAECTPADDSVWSTV